MFISLEIVNWVFWLQICDNDFCFFTIVLFDIKWKMKLFGFLFETLFENLK